MTTSVRRSNLLLIDVPMLGNVIRLNNVASEQNCTLDEFRIIIAIDGCTYSIKFHIVSNTIMRYDLLVGIYSLNNKEIHIKDENILISKINIKENLPKVVQIDIVQETNEVDPTHIENPGHQQFIKDLQQFIKEQL